MKSKINSNYITIGLFILFLLVIFFLPFKNTEFFRVGQWKNNIKPKIDMAGYCAPDFSKFGKNDNVAVRCIGDGKMTYDDCCKIRNMGQVCGVNLDNWEIYECKYYPGRACERCKTQNAQY